MTAQNVIDAAVERWGGSWGGAEPLVSAQWFLENEFPGIHHATCYFQWLGEGDRGSPFSWLVYLHTTKFKDDPGARTFEADAMDLGWAMCAALQAAADAGLHTGVPPAPPPPERPT